MYSNKERQSIYNPITTPNLASNISIKSRTVRKKKIYKIAQQKIPQYLVVGFRGWQHFPAVAIFSGEKAAATAVALTKKHQNC